MIPRIHSVALALLFAATLPGLAQAPTGGTQLLNPNPKDCCNCIEIEEIPKKENEEEKEDENQPPPPPPIIYLETDGTYRVPVSVTVKNDGACKAPDTPSADHSKDVKIKTVVLRPVGSSTSSYQENIPVTDGTSASKEVTLLGSTVASSGTKNWEIFVTCSGNAMVPPNTPDPDGFCTYRITLGGCKSCSSGSCEGHAESGSFTYDIPVGSADGGDTTGAIRFYTPDFNNPGLSGVAAFVPSTYTVNRSEGVITSVVTPTNTIEFARTATAFDPNAFTIHHRRAGESDPFRTTTITRVQDGDITYLRADSTYDSITFRYQQKKEQNASTVILTMESGPVTGGAFTAQRKEILQTSEPQPGTQIRREIKQEWDSLTSAFVTTSDTATTWNKFAWGWEKTQEAVDPDGANLINNWTYYQPGELSGPNGSSEGFGRVHTHTRYDGWQEIHTYWLNHHQVQQPFADNPQGLTILSKYDPADRSTITTKTVGGNTLSKESESYNPATNTRVSKTHTSGDGALTTTTILMPYGQDFGGKPKSISHPNGTHTTYTYARNGNIGKTVTIRSGVIANLGNPDNETVTHGTTNVTVYNATGSPVFHTETFTAAGKSIVTENYEVTQQDAFGRPEEVSHFGGKYTTSTSYNCCGVASKKDQHGNETAYTYDSLRRQKTTTSLGVTTETVRRGLTIDTHRYPAGGSAAPGNLVARNSGNLANTQSSSWSPDPSSSAAGALVETTTVTTFEGGISTTVTTVPGGANQTSKTYADGRAYQTTGDLSPAMIHFYAVNATGLLTTSSYLDGGTPVETVCSQTDWAGRTLLTAKGPQTTIQAYNAAGQLISATDADGVCTLFAYDDLGERTTTAVDSNGNGAIDLDGTDNISVTTLEPGTYASTPVLTTSSSIYSTNGSTAVTTSINHRTPDGLESWALSPGVANPSHSVATIGSDGAWTDITTNPDGTSVKNTHTGGRLEKTDYFTSDTTPVLVISTSYLYDTLGRPWKSTDARTGTTETVYVSATCDTVRATTDPGDRTTSFTHNVNGHRLTTTLPDNTVSHASYYPSGEVRAIWGSQTYPVYFTYDHAGRKLTMRTKPTLDANGAPTNNGASLIIWNYSPVTGLLESKLDADDQGPSYTYTPAGRILTRTWARPISSTNPTKVKTTYGYTSGLLTTVSYNDGTPNLEYTYTRFGAQDTVKRGGTLHADYDYDESTLSLTTEKLNQDTIVARSLNHYSDSLGRPLSLEVSGEYTTAYGYDNASRLNRVWNHPALDANKAPTGSADFTYGYTPNSSLIASVTGPIHTVTNTWESTRNALELKENKVGATVVSSHDYGVTPLGQRAGVQQAGTAFAATRGITWGYDSFGQVISADSTNNTDDRAYQFDAIGNRLFSEISNPQISNPPVANTTAYTPNPLNQYTAVASFSPSYDLDGNQVNAQILPPGSSSPVSGVFRWDAENRLIEVKDSDGNVIVANTYDYLCRLISRTAGGTTTHYLYDGWNRIGEFSGTTLQMTFTWGLDLSNSVQGAGGVGGLLAVKSGSAVHYPTLDGNGNVSEYLTSAGSIAAHFEYDPFGNTVVNTDLTGKFAYRFSTKPLDTVTGLYYYGYRYYDPLNGRWPSRDPIEEEGGINLYGFVGNVSVSNIDRVGLYSVFSYGDSVGITTPDFITIEGGYSINGDFDPETCCVKVAISGNLDFGLGILIKRETKRKYIGLGFTFGYEIQATIGKLPHKIEGEFEFCKDGSSGVVDLELLAINIGLNLNLSGFGSGGIGFGGVTISGGLGGKAYVDLSLGLQGEIKDNAVNFYLTTRFGFVGELYGDIKGQLYKGIGSSQTNVGPEFSLGKLFWDDYTGKLSLEDLGLAWHSGPEPVRIAGPLSIRIP